MNILFYGFRHGHIFGCFQEAQKRSDCNILAALEENEEARAAAEQKLGVQFDNGAYEQWLEDPAVEAVAFGGAYGDRGKAVIQALEHGKHVISDKPICTSMAELEEIQRLSREKGLRVGCLLDLRYVAAAGRAKELFASGRMGAVKNITFTGQHCIDYGNRPTWYFEPGMHGGTINDIAIHGVDIIPYLTGHSITKIHCARTWNAFATRHPHFMDSAQFMAETDGGAGVMADVSYAAPSQVFSMPTYWNFQIWCEKGLVTFCAPQPDVTIYMNGEKGPEVLPGVVTDTTPLGVFMEEVQKGTWAYTESVLKAARTALTIQKAADEYSL